MSQASLLTDLLASFAFADGIIASAHVMDPNGGFVNAADVRAFMTEAAVVKMHVAWEHYLEQSFLEYLMGSPSATGAVIKCFLVPPSIEHARRVLIGTQKYVDWANPDIVTRLAELYFENGGPYKTAIAAVHGDLLDLRAVRNAAAHLSTTTSERLDKVALRRLNRAVIGITVYDLVTAIDPAGAGQTLFATYGDLLAAAANVIAQG
jgi:hypothetical protein